MQPEERDQLRTEESRARRAELAYKEFIEPFLEGMRLTLYNAFNSVSPEDTTRLADVRRTSMVVDELDAYIKEFITTGRMAKMRLNEDD